MQEENKKQTKKVLEDSLMKNEDLMIMPGSEAQAAASAQASPNVEPAQTKQPVLKVIKKKKKSTFDMNLNVLKHNQDLEKAQKSVIKDEAKSLKLFSFVFKEPKSLLVEFIKNGLVLILSLGIFLFSIYIQSIISHNIL